VFWGSSPGIKRSGPKADLSPSSSDDVKVKVAVILLPLRAFMWYEETILPFFKLLFRTIITPTK
jgi:hypothetical protein